ncbi:hypothetical protein LPJ66_004261 [Kickxella alabastrina]|uniref:Uncharacterized protein n=1 Tax=Kickxella alabastrina TaxID=61397 RepID=A0ACC1IK55_9FUNG|nr:hypothetical protein LPJ66_004261 [Kickxella alabastrina]
MDRPHQALQTPASPPIHSLPEYLYHAYESTPSAGVVPAERPMLIDARTDRTITYTQFKQMSATLATTLHSRYGITSGHTIAILSSSSIDIPIISAAAWILCANIVMLTPKLNPGESDIYGYHWWFCAELNALMRANHMPSIFFASAMYHQAIQETILSYIYPEEMPYIIRMSPDVDIDGGEVLGNYNLPDLYTPRPNTDPPYSREVLCETIAQELAAVLYFTHAKEEHGPPVIEVTRMSHANTIYFYLNTQRRYLSSMPHPSDISPSTVVLGVKPTYTVFRLHLAYRLHKTIMDLFCCNATYLVAEFFDIDEFIRVVDQYEVKNAELGFEEINTLIAHLRGITSITSTSSSSGAGVLMGSLRFIYTASKKAVEQLAPRLAEVLPGVQIIRTRFGSYIDPPA